MDKKKSLPDTKKCKTAIGKDTQELFSELDKDSQLFNELLEEEVVTEKKTKKKRKGRDLKDPKAESDLSDIESANEKDSNVKKGGKNGKVKKLNYDFAIDLDKVDLDEKSDKSVVTKASTKSNKEGKRSITKEKVSKPKSKEKNQKKTWTEKEAIPMVRKFMIEVRTYCF